MPMMSPVRSAMLPVTARSLTCAGAHGGSAMFCSVQPGWCAPPVVSTAWNGSPTYSRRTTTSQPSARPIEHSGFVSTLLCFRTSAPVSGFARSSVSRRWYVLCSCVDAGVVVVAGVFGGRSLIVARSISHEHEENERREKTGRKGAQSVSDSSEEP